MTLFALANGLSALAPDYHAMLVFRFLSGLPHGAYFGIAALVAASLVPVERRTQAVGRVMLGLTAATILGVPLANGLGQAAGWRWGFAVVAAARARPPRALLFALRPARSSRCEGASPLARARRAAQRAGVAHPRHRRHRLRWICSAVYTYLASTLLAVTGVSAHVVPLVLSVFGVGMTVGNLVVPRFADRWQMASAGACLVWTAVALALYTVATRSLVAVTLDVLAIGSGAALATVLQTRLMDVAGEAQGLAAALNHAAFNVANAIGPWLGGLAIAAGYGWASTGWVGCGPRARRSRGVGHLGRDVAPAPPRGPRVIRA